MQVVCGNSLATALTLLVAVAAASASPRVVVIEAPETLALPALGTEVELHAGRDVIITTTTVAAGSVPAAQAPEILASHDATLVVWIEPAPDRGGLVVYVAGRWPNRAVIELVRVDAATSANEQARMIALKIVSVLDAILAPRPVATALGVRVDEMSTSGWRVALGVDALAGGDRGAAAGPVAMVERRWQREPLELSGTLSARALLARAIETPLATVAIDDADAALAFELAYWRLFARLGGGVALVWADATSTDGRRGSAFVVIPTVELGVGARLSISSAELALMIGIDHAVIRQRFVVDNMIATDLGRDRVMARLAVSLPIP